MIAGDHKAKMLLGPVVRAVDVMDEMTKKRF